MIVLWIFLYVLLGVLGLLLIALFLPVGIRFRYNAEGVLLKLVLGPVRWRLYPRKKKCPKEEKEKPKKKVKQKEKSKKTEEKKTEEQKKGGTIRPLLQYVPLGMEFLGDIRRSILMRKLELFVNLAGDDPCDLAILYGTAWGAIEAVRPMMHNAFRIRKEDVQVFCDFTAESTEVYVDTEIVACPARLLVIVLRYGWRALEIYRKQNEKAVPKYEP